MPQDVTCLDMCEVLLRLQECSADISTRLADFCSLLAKPF